MSIRLGPFPSQNPAWSWSFSEVVNIVSTKRAEWPERCQDGYSGIIMPPLALRFGGL